MRKLTREQAIEEILAASSENKVLAQLPHGIDSDLGAAGLYYVTFLEVVQVGVADIRPFIQSDLDLAQSVIDKAKGYKK